MRQYLKYLGVVACAAAFALPLAANAATVSLTGSAFGPGEFSGYGTGGGMHNVVNGPSIVSDPTSGSLWLTGGTASVAGGNPSYSITWWLIGAEAANNTYLTAPGASFTKGVGGADINSNAIGGTTIFQAPVNLGTTNLNIPPDSTVIPFTMGDFTTGGSVANGSNNAPNSGSPNMVMAYASVIEVAGIPTIATLIGNPSNWFVVGLNDDGSPDDNHDDLVLLAHVTCDGCGAEQNVPLPAALPLFAGGLAVLGFVGRRRRRAA